MPVTARLASSTHQTRPDPLWRTHELLLMSQVMRLVGQSLAPDVVLREMLHLMSELLGLNRGRIVLADFVGDIALEGLAAQADRKPPPRLGVAAGPASAIRYAYGLTRTEMARGKLLADEGIDVDVFSVPSSRQRRKGFSKRCARRFKIAQ